MPKMNLWRVIRSVLQAMIGVQSERNRQEDFASGKAGHFIIAGVCIVIVFVLSLILLVKSIMYFT